MKVLFELQGEEEFEEYLRGVKNRFALMVNTMKDVAEIIKANTLPRTPLETGRLGESFEYTVLKNIPRETIVQIRMSALNPNTGYDYAGIQHFNLSYSHAHGGALYLMRGIMASESMSYQIIEQDYLSLFGGGFIEK